MPCAVCEHGGKHITFDATAQDRVRGLLGCGGRSSRPERSAAQCIDDEVFGGERRRAPRPDLSRQSPDRSSAATVSSSDTVGSGPVCLVQVDVVDAEASQAVVDGLHDPTSRVAAPVGVVVVADRVMELRAQHRRRRGDRAMARPTISSFWPSAYMSAVSTRLIPASSAPVDDAVARVEIGVSPVAEHHRPEPEPADVHAGSSEWTHLHQITSDAAYFSPRMNGRASAAGGRTLRREHRHRRRS